MCLFLCLPLLVGIYCFELPDANPATVFFSLAWAEMYLVMAALVQKFDFDFRGLTADHFEVMSDQFIINTKGKAVLEALVSLRQT